MNFRYVFKLFRHDKTYSNYFSSNDYFLLLKYNSKYIRRTTQYVPLLHELLSFYLFENSKINFDQFIQRVNVLNSLHLSTVRRY